MFEASLPSPLPRLRAATRRTAARLRLAAERLVHQVSRAPSDAPDDAWPPMDLARVGSHLELTVELPGVRAGDLALDLDGDILVLSGEARQALGTDRCYFVQERGTGIFARALRLPRRVDPAGAVAVLADGLLTITLLIVPPDRVRSVPVGGRGAGPARSQGA